MNVKQKILIADDSEINRALLMEILGDGYEYLEAENGVRAVELLREHTDIALVLLDINLPDGSGLDFLSEIKTSSPLRPVILLTANDTDMDIVNGLEQGADDYITKPFSLSVLRARVNTQLRKKNNRADSIFRDHGFVFDFDRMQFWTDGTAVVLS